MTEVSGANQVNREEFYRQQLKKHSIQQFREQTLNRMKRFDEAGVLAQKGRSKNHLASLGSDHLDLMT